MDNSKSTIFNAGVMLVAVPGAFILLMVTAFYMRECSVSHEREINERSAQYQEARKEAMIILEQDIARLDTEITKANQSGNTELQRSLEAQRKVLVKRHARESARLRKSGE